MPAADGGGARARFLAAAAPALFVVLWATGFIGARMTMPHAEPMILLVMRFALAGAVLLLAAAVMRSPWPRRRALVHVAVAGILIQAIYLGGVFAATRLGLEAGVSALIVGVQPLVTAALAGPVLGERVGPVKWAGLALGALGVALVIEQKLEAGLGTPLAVGLCTVSLFAIAIGTLYQKRFAAAEPIVTATIVQYGASALLCLALSFLFETRAVDWTGTLVFGLVWLALVLSCGAVTLLYWLLRHGAAANVASLFFMVPPCAALMGWALFGETMSGSALLGMALAAAGVATVSRAGARSVPAAGPMR
ncbi:DMT family transporter [Propylenella binzhouense]|uniref:DMT family transporter n=1 Tax=Propylenella binzhouense TaxID=2555902 RepID=A0A964T5N8_9HYPH|nr:DMT family transporter [Propylenella binzhouense]MYZ48284.1 DMT family transporter [Propylenella binzhouense]